MALMGWRLSFSTVMWGMDRQTYVIQVQPRCQSKQFHYDLSSWSCLTASFRINSNNLPGSSHDNTGASLELRGNACHVNISPVALRSASVRKYVSCSFSHIMLHIFNLSASISFLSKGDGSANGSTEPSRWEALVKWKENLFGNKRAILWSSLSPRNDFKLENMQ